MIKRFLHKASLLLVMIGTLTLFINIQSEHDIVQAQNIIYVSSSATSANRTGLSWDNAYGDLQEALNNAQMGDEIWVAAGTYIPSKNEDRIVSFKLKNGVSIYGGFIGSETEREDRDWTSSITILSGDLLNNDNGSNNFTNNVTREDNSFHVIYGEDLNNETILDGFVISGGNSLGEQSNQDGAGALIINSSATFSNIHFKNNTANRNGGGVYIDNNKLDRVRDNFLVWENIVFESNVANQNGGGIHNDGSDFRLIDATFKGNIALEHGGGLFNSDSDYQLVNALFHQNSSEKNGGGIYDDESMSHISKSVFRNNTAEWGGGIYNNGSNGLLNSSTITDNIAKVNGGGIYNSGSSLSVLNSTISHNLAKDKGGGIYNKRVEDEQSRLTLNHTTIFNNIGDNEGGGIYEAGVNIHNIKNSIIVDNKSGENLSNCKAVLNSHGFNIVKRSNECMIQQIENEETDIEEDPILLPLPSNLESEGVYVLSKQSVGVDQGSCHDLDGFLVMTDQLNFSRPFGEMCDIGALEWTGATETLINLPLILSKKLSPYFEGPWEEEPNNAPLDGAFNGLLVSGRTYYGTFETSADVTDYFSINLSQAQLVTISLTNIPEQGDYDLTLRIDNSDLDSPSGGHSGAAGSESETIETTVPAGKYFIQVSNRKDQYSTQPYHLVVTYR